MSPQSVGEDEPLCSRFSGDVGLMRPSQVLTYIKVRDLINDEGDRGVRGHTVTFE